MSNYCVECGAHLAGGRFCPECGHPVPDAPQLAADGEVGQQTVATQASSPDLEAAPLGSPTQGNGWRRHPVVVFAAIAGLLTIGLLSAWVIRGQTQIQAEQQAARLAQEQAQAEAEAKAEAKAERQRLRRAKAKARAQALKEAENEDPDVVVVPAFANPYDGPVDGTWSGTMDDGRYTFWLSVSEYGGQLDGEMYQEETATGRSGTEIVTGYRDGGVLYLHGIRWRNAPATWTLDDMSLTLSESGQSFTGTYTCSGCSGTNSISGRRE